MNTAKNASSHSAITGSLKSLGRGIAVASAVALGGVSTLSAADASAAGVATGIRHASTVSTATPESGATSLSLDSHAAYRIRDGKITRL